MTRLCRFLLFLGLACPAVPSAASMPIDIRFETDRASGAEWIRARTEYDADKARIYGILDAVGEYPALHGWIQDTKIESDAGNGKQQVVIKFKFPWPVGERWSRVEVLREGDSVISWNQLDGTLKMNRGRIAITGQARQTYIDYEAVIDVGYPDTVTRNYKKRFVSEFLGAIHDRTNDGSRFSDATATGSPRRMLATSYP